MVGMDDQSPIEMLTTDAAFDRLAAQSLGRLVVRRKDDMDIFPVNYVLDRDAEEPVVYFRTAEGAKLFSVNLNSDVLFEVDHVEGDAAWSVVIKGEATLVKDTKEIQHADTLPLRPWIPTLKYNYVRIRPTSVSGRAFTLGEEPERY